MTQQPPNQPFGIPGSPSLGIPGAPPQGQPSGQPGGPSLQKPAFEQPIPPSYGLPGGAPGAALVLAGWGARWGALIIDGIVRGLVAVIISTAIFVVVASDPFSTAVYDVEGISNLGGIFVAAFFLYYVLPLIYGPVFMAMWNGQTPGKRVVGIRVVTELGVAPSFGGAFLREAVFKTVIVTWIGGLFFLPWLLNFLWPLWDDQSRAGHDFMARTRVVKA